MNDGFEVAFFGGDERETLGQVKAHLVAKDAVGAGAGAVFLESAGVQHMLHKV